MRRMQVALLALTCAQLATAVTYPSCEITLTRAAGATDVVGFTGNAYVKKTDCCVNASPPNSGPPYGKYVSKVSVDPKCPRKGTDWVYLYYGFDCKGDFVQNRKPEKPVYSVWVCTPPTYPMLAPPPAPKKYPSCKITLTRAAGATDVVGFTGNAYLKKSDCCVNASPPNSGPPYGKYVTKVSVDTKCPRKGTDWVYLYYGFDCKGDFVLNRKPEKPVYSVWVCPPPTVPAL